MTCFDSFSIRQLHLSSKFHTARATCETRPDLMKTSVLIPFRRFAMERFQHSIEIGVPLLRSASAGISGAFDPWGRVLGIADFYADGDRTLTVQVPIGGVRTLYARTGDLFACDYDGIKADILVVGKALAGGFYPVSAALANEPLMGLFRPGEHGSTFGGNPLGCAVAVAALDVIAEEKLASRARYAGAKIMQGLRAINSPLVEEVRGRGLLIGVQMKKPARLLSDELLERGVAAKDTHDNVLRIAPPLVIDDEAIDFLLGAFREAIATIT